MAELQGSNNRESREAVLARLEVEKLLTKDEVKQINESEKKEIKIGKRTISFLDGMVEEPTGEYYLYKEGNQYTDRTGGWKNFEKVSITGGIMYEEKSIYMTSAKWGGHSLTTIKDLDYTGYSKYCYRADIYVTDKAPYEWSRLTWTGTDTLNSPLYVHGQIGNNLIIKVDISHIGKETADDKIAMSIFNDASIRIHEIWLEK